MSEILEEIPQISWDPLGLEGWLNHLDVPYTRYLLKYSHFSSHRPNKESLVHISETFLTDRPTNIQRLDVEALSKALNKTDS